MAAQRFFIETFGCQMNEHDSEKLAGLLTHRGLIPAESPQDADLFLLNTCSVRDKAVQKVYSRLGEVKREKARNPQFLIGVVGCVAQQEGELMTRRAPFVDLVLGTHRYHELPDLLEQLEASPSGRRTGRVETGFLGDPQPVELPAALRKTPFRANITIMEGCNKHCSFCIVPFTRGPERNRPAERILEEVKRAVDQGYVEVLLLGQTVNSYRDPRDRRFGFGELLRQTASIAGVRRLRFTSPHPREFDGDAISVIGEFENICEQIHLPVQSGSTTVLRRMHRQYTRDQFLELVEKFRNCGRPVSFSTDVIVGFPGETEEDFEATLSLTRQVRFESMFSFNYSPRPFTKALGFEDDVPPEEKSRRLSLLQRTQKEIQHEVHRKRYLNRRFEVLVEGKARDGRQQCGRTSSNKVVNFPGDGTPGTFEEVEITQVGPNSLRGEAVS